MNERIRELRAQCKEESIDGPGYPDWVDLEKFAELIVHQSLELLREKYHGLHDDSRIQEGVLLSLNTIHEHFGVE